MQLKSHIAEYLRALLEAIAAKKHLKLAITGDLDLVDSGLVDSMEFLRLVSDIEAQFGIEVDFNDPEPGVFTTLNGLARHCARFGKAA